MHIESQEGVRSFVLHGLLRLSANYTTYQSPIDLSYDPPHLIMTYTSLLSLSILRDDFTQLDRKGLVNLLRATQKEDGRFVSLFPSAHPSIVSIRDHITIIIPDLNRLMRFLFLALVGNYIDNILISASPLSQTEAKLIFAWYMLRL